VPLIRATPPLPAGRFSKALDLVAAHLKSPGTDLARYVKTWQFGRGEDYELIDPGDWTTEHFPALRLDIEGGGAGWLNQVTSRTAAQYRITLGLDGSDCRHALDFWEAVVSRLYPGDNSLYSKLKDPGVSVFSYTVTLAALKRSDYEGGTGQICEGVLTLNTEFPTKY